MNKIVEINKSWLFGLIRLHVVVEDKRPEFKPHQNLSKYKTSVDFKYFNKSWQIIMYSKAIEYICIEEPNMMTSLSDE